MDAFVHWLVFKAPKVRHVVVIGSGIRREVRVLISDEKKIQITLPKKEERSLAQRNGDAISSIKRRITMKVSKAEARLQRIKQQERQHGN